MFSVMDFHLERAYLKGPDWFARFAVPADGALQTPLAEANLDPDTELLLFERGGETRALLVRQMAYHHVAQGQLRGEPYVVTF